MDEIWKTLINNIATAGVAGAVLAWFLMQFKPENDKLRDEIRNGFSKTQDALDRATRANLIRLAVSALTSPEVKKAAEELNVEIDTATADRAKESVK